MPLIDVTRHEINCSFVYYGPPQRGKSTTIHALYHMLSPQGKEGLRTFLIENDQPVEFFDYLLDLPLNALHGFQPRLRIQTIVGPELFQSPRRSLLRGADAIVFVADAQASKLQENVQYWNEVRDTLTSAQKDPATFPLVIQWNKHDLPGAMPSQNLEHFLNLYHCPSFETVAVTAQGISESFKAVVNSFLSTIIE